MLSFLRMANGSPTSRTIQDDLKFTQNPFPGLENESRYRQREARKSDGGVMAKSCFTSRKMASSWRLCSMRHESANLCLSSSPRWARFKTYRFLITLHLQTASGF